jgi:hypothetical protein
MMAIAGVAHLLNIGSGTGGPITVSRGGTLSVGGTEQNKTIACNGGSLTLSAINSMVNVTGHCASHAMSGFDNHVNVESADAVQVSGYDNTVTDTACSDGKPTLSGYNNAFTVGGHCASLTVSNYGNRVEVDGIDTITVNNYGNRFTVTGHCGSLKVAAYEPGADRQRRHHRRLGLQQHSDLPLGLTKDHPVGLRHHREAGLRSVPGMLCGKCKAGDRDSAMPVTLTRLALGDRNTRPARHASSVPARPPTVASTDDPDTAK